MFVYIWKDPQGIPFYVGMGQRTNRSNPKSVGHRNKACVSKVNAIGPDNVIVEVKFVASEVEAKELESQLIQQYGKISDGSGTLTNISRGGEFHTASEETCEKLRELWNNPEHRGKILSKRVGAQRDLSESTKEKLRANLKNNPRMKGWGERNGKDPEFEAKRIAGLKLSQDRRLAKMSAPDALAQRKARLKATMNSPEMQEKRRAFMTTEYRAKLSEAKRLYWARRKGLL